MNKGPYQAGYQPVQAAANAVINQEQTMLDELHASIDRVAAYHANRQARAQEKAQDDAYWRLMLEEKKIMSGACVSAKVGRVADITHPKPTPRPWTLPTKGYWR